MFRGKRFQNPMPQIPSGHHVFGQHRCGGFHCIGTVRTEGLKTVFQRPVPQPVIQRCSRVAIVAVVVVNRLQQRGLVDVVGLTALHPVVVLHDRSAAALHIAFPSVPVEVFKVLDGIRRLADPKPFANGLIQINKHPASKQRVHLVFAGGVFAHQLPHRRHLVGGVMKHVHRWIGRPPLHYPINKRFKGRLFLRLVVRPKRAKLQSAARPGCGPKQVFQTALHQGVAFDIEKHIHGARSRQPTKPLARFEFSGRHHAVDRALEPK